MSVYTGERVTIPSVAAGAASMARSVPLSVRGLVQMLLWRTALYRSRLDLRDLSDSQLKDIGVTREAAAAEARRGFDWR